MPYSPLEGFKIGQELGKAKKSTFGRVSGNLLDQFNKQTETGQKLGASMALEKYKAGVMSPKQQAETELAQEKTKAIKGGRSFGRLTPEDLAARKQKLGMPPDQAGRLESALEGVRAIRHMKKVLFPDGTPESFQRQTAYAKSPFPFKKPVPNTYEARTLYRRAGQAIAGKLLVQSGVQTRKEEYERLGEQMVANAFSSPREAFESLDEGEAFYRGFTEKIDPSKLFHSDDEMDPFYNYKSQQNDSGVTREQALEELRRRGVKI